MRTIILLSSILIFSILSCTTNRGVNQAFHKYGSEEGVTVITVPGWLIRLGSNIGDMDESERDLVRSIKKVKILTVQNSELNERINLHEEFIHSINSKQDYEQLVNIKDKQDDVSIIGKFDGDVIKELIVLVGGSDNVIVYLKGKFDPALLKNMVDESQPVKVKLDALNI